MNIHLLRNSFFLMRKIRISLFLLLFSFTTFFSSNGWGQSVFDWYDTAPDGNWRRGADGARWTGGLWDEPGFGVLRFNNNHQLTMTNNVSGTYSQHSIIFGSSNTSNRTISGNTVRFYDFSGTDPKIENQSSGSHTINFNIEGDGATDPLEMNPTSGNLTFGGTVNNQGTDIFVFGNNGNTITYNGVISGAGKFIIKQNSKAVFNATNTYTGNTELDAGELWIGTGGDISSSSSIYLGNGSSTATVAKLWLSNSSGGTTFSRNITVNNGNTTTRYIGGINTSGTHTLSGNITNNSSGGVYLSAELAGGTTAFSGVVSGSNPVITSGAGTLILSGSSANIYSGVTTFDAATTVLNKTANTIAIPTNGTLNNGKTLRTDAANQWGTGTPPLLTINGNGIFNLNNNNQKVALASSSSSASITLGSATLNIDNTATDTYDGTISGTGGVLKSNNGTQIFTNTGLSYTGSTTITAGTLTLNPSANATFASQVDLNGGTLSTSGITATRTWTSSSTLNLTASSTIALSSGTNHAITFAASNAVAWTAGQTLTITGWTGSIGSSGTGGKIFIGNSASGLTSTQLSQIVFTGFGGAMQLSTGEIVPNGVITWVNSSAASSWATSANWSPSTSNIQWSSGSIAQFQNAGSATLAGINFNSTAGNFNGSLSIGAIEVTSERTRALTINSSSSTGNLILNGVTLNSTSNTILRNASGFPLSIQNGSGTVNLVLGNATTNVIEAGSGGITISSVISGATRSITKIGSGTLTLSAVNTYTGSTTIETGILSLGIANAIPVGGTGVNLNGGTLNTGASTGFSLGSSSTNVGTLTLSSSSTISLGTGDHSLYFSGASFTAGQTLTITGWTGTSGASGTGGKIFIGNSASLTSAQLAQISFSGVNGIAIQLASGEIVPTSTFYSKSTGSLNDLSSWGTNTDGTGIAPANFTNNGITYNIRNNATPTIGASWTVSGTGSKIVVGDGTNACNFTVPGSLTVTSPTTEVSNNGTITRTTTGANSWGTLTFASGAKYVHNVSGGGTLPTANWNANSTLQIDQSVTNDNAHFNQNFGNITINGSSAFTIIPSTASFSTLSIAGSLTFNSSGTVLISNRTVSVTSSISGDLNLTGTGSLWGAYNSGALTLNVSGKYNQSNGFFYYSNNTTNQTMTITGNLELSGGTFRINDDKSTSNGRNHKVITNGNFIMSGGTFNFTNESNSGVFSNSVYALLEVKGNFTHTGGTISESATDADVITRITLTGTSGTQTIESTGQTGIVNFNVAGSNSQCVVSATKMFVLGSGNMTVADGTSSIDLLVDGILRSASTITTDGAVTFSSTGTYEHNQNGGAIPTATWSNGSTCSVIGNTGSTPTGLGQTFHNFTWNSAGMTQACGLSGGLTTVNGTLSLISTNAKELRLTSSNGSAYSGSFGNIDISGGILTLIGSSTSGTNTSTVSVSGNLTLSGSGILEMNGGDNAGTSILNIAGNLTTSGTSVIRRTFSASSSIVFNKSSGIQYMTQTAGTISNTINWNIGTGSTTNTLELGSNVNLGSGTGTLTVADGSALDLKGYALTGSFGTTINGTGVSNSGAFYTSTGTPSFARPITLGTSALIKSSGTSLTLTGGVVTASGKNLTIDGTGSTTFSTAAISGAGSVVKNGAGNLTYSFANTYTGSTTLNAGTLTLGATTAIATAGTGGGVILNGGTYSSGSSTGFTVGTSSLNMGTLTLTENTALSLGTGGHSLYFAASNGVGWTNGKTLAITGWTGSAGTTGTAGKIFIGSSSSGLTAGQLLQITINSSEVEQLSTGEIVPRAVIYRSAQSGNWNSNLTWEVSSDNGSFWNPASSPPNSAIGSITVRSNHNVTVTESVTIDQTTINSGGTITVNSSQTLTVANGDGTDLTINGTLINNGTVSNSGLIQVNSGGIYNHANGTAIPTGLQFGTNGSAGTLEVSGSATSDNVVSVSGTNELYHLIWSSSGNMPGAFGSSQGTLTLCNGDFSFSGNSSFQVAASGSGNLSNLIIGGNLNLTGGSININYGNSMGSGGNARLTVQGNYNHSSGTMNLCNNSTSYGAYLYVEGNFNHNGGTITNTANSSSQTIYLSKTTGSQNIESIGQSNNMTFNVAGSNAQCVIAASKTFVLSSSSTLTVANGTSTPDLLVDGTINSSGTITYTGSTTTVNGTLRNAGTSTNASTTTLTFSSTGTYEHNFTTTTGTIPTATWSSGSTCSIIGYTNTSVTINSSYGQSFSNFTWNCPSQSVAINLLGLLTTVNGNFNLQSAGTGSVTYNTNSPASPSLTIGGNCTINASINLNNGNSTPTFNIAGDFSQTAGTISKAGAGNTIINFNKSSGTQSFSQSGGTISNSINWNVGNGTSTNIMELASNVNLGTGTGTFTVLGNATLDAKTYVLSGSNAFTTNSGSNLITAHADGINGSITSTGTKTLNSNMNYTFNGSNAQATGSLLTNANNITINNAAGVTMSTNASISGLLSLTNGKLSLGSTTLTLSNDVSGGSSTSYIVAYDNNGTIGKIKQSIPVTKQYIFPIGDQNVYSPVRITFNSGTSLSSAFLEVYTKPSKVTGMSSSVEKVLNRSWIVEHSGITNPNFDIRYTYGTGEDVGANGINLDPVKLSDGVWYKPANSVLPNGTPLGNATDINILPSNTLEWTGLTSFSEFGGAGGGSPLPVELTSFHASCEDEGVVLNWSTASEQNSSHFDVEKSENGTDWRVIGTVLAAGNSTQDINYSFIDSEKSKGANYYRLNQVDIDGKNKFYGPIQANCEGVTDLLMSFPNPSDKNGLSVVLNTKNLEGNGILSISDSKGNIIYTKEIEVEKGISLWNINEPNLATGVYFIKISVEESSLQIIKHIQH